MERLQQYGQLNRKNINYIFDNDIQEEVLVVVDDELVPVDDEVDDEVVPVNDEVVPVISPVYDEVVEVLAV